MGLGVLALLMVAACVTVQSAGTIFLLHWIYRVRHVLESPGVFLRLWLLLRVFACIVSLHLIQVALWAVLFWQAGQLQTLEMAVYFSLTSYTTIGFGDLVLGPRWRVLAGIEGLIGILLIGWSTAFVFAIINRMYQHWRDIQETS
jgi:hypothetical protein